MRPQVPNCSSCWPRCICLVPMHLPFSAFWKLIILVCDVFLEVACYQYQLDGVEYSSIFSIKKFRLSFSIKYFKRSMVYVYKLVFYLLVKIIILRSWYSQTVIPTIKTCRSMCISKHLHNYQKNTMKQYERSFMPVSIKLLNNYFRYSMKRDSHTHTHTLRNSVYLSTE